MPLTIFQPGQRIASAAMNANFDFLKNLFGGAVARHFDQDDATTAALTWSYVGGVVRSATGSISVVASGTVALAPNATNRVELNPATGAVAVQSSASWTVGRIPLRLLVTSDFAVTSNADVRAWAAAAPAVQWNDILNKPTTFAPSAHTHAATDITGLGNAATRNVGTTVGTVAAGDDSRFSDARTPANDALLVHKYDYTNLRNAFFTGPVPYQSRSDNFFFCADKRFGLTLNGVASDLSAFFDGDWEQPSQFPSNSTNVFGIDLTTKGEYDAQGLTYSDGYVYVCFFGTATPQNVTGRTRDKDGIWHNCIGTTVLGDANGQVWRLQLSGHNNITQFEITVIAKSSFGAWVTEIECHLLRPGSSASSGIDKYRAQKLYQRWDGYDINNSRRWGLDPSTGTHYAKGDYVCDDPTRGVVLKSPNGHYWRLSVSDTGNISTVDLGTVAPN